MSQKCRVCLNGGAAVHYGGVVCGSCKIFFARTVQKRKIYVCEVDGECILGTDRRPKCRSCRFRACVNAGMVTEEVGRLRDTVVVDELPEQLSVVPDMDFTKLPRRNSFIRPYTSETFTEVKLRPSEFVRILTGLERFCNDHDEDIDAETSLEFSTREVLENPVCIASPSKELPSLCETKDDCEKEEYRLQYCRFLVHYTDFVRGCKEIYSLTPDDRDLLFSKQLCMVLTVTTAYKRYLNGVITEKRTRVETASIKDLSDRLSDDMNRRIVSTFLLLKASEEEYVLLKMICLFHKDTGLSEGGLMMVRNARHRYEQMLIDYTYESRTDLSEEERNTRLATLFSIVTHIVIVSKMADQQFSRMVVADFAQMRCGLTFDIHLREK